jgi:DNA-binding NarL/FixJ family response regulator
MDPRPIKIAVADAEPASRFGIVHFIRCNYRTCVSLEIESAAHGDVLFGDSRPDVALVDTELDGGGGLDLIRRMQRSPRSIPCVAWLRRCRSEDVEAAVRVRAKGIVLRSDNLQEILKALIAVSNGRCHFSSEVAAEIGNGLYSGRESADGDETLPARQLQVFRLLGDGLSSKEIAIKMGVSFKTVQTHIERLKARMGCRNQAALFRRATVADLRNMVGASQEPVRLKLTSMCETT